MREIFDEINLKDAKELSKEELIKIGKKLKQLRTENSLTLNDVAFFLYSNISTVERLELGKLDNITLLTLIKFAAFYKIPITELFN